MRSRTSCSVRATFACAIVRDRLDPLHVAVPPRRIGRHRDDPRIQAAEPGDDELQPRRIEQEGPLARHPQIDQPGRDRPRVAVELLVGQARFARPRRRCSNRPLPAAAARSNSGANRPAWSWAAKTERQSVSGPRTGVPRKVSCQTTNFSQERAFLIGRNYDAQRLTLGCFCKYPKKQLGCELQAKPERDDPTYPVVQPTPQPHVRRGAPSDLAKQICVSPGKPTDVKCQYVLD